MNDLSKETIQELRRLRRESFIEHLTQTYDQRYARIWVQKAMITFLWGMASAVGLAVWRTLFIYVPTLGK